MKPLPMLRWLREWNGLSQRDLAKRSGVARDTIGQIERGARQARPSTIQKLAAALGMAPFILASSIEELATFTERELFERLEEELDDSAAAREALDRLRSFFIEFGYAQQQAAWEESKAAASYEDLLKDIAVAYKKLHPSQDSTDSGELTELAEATVLLARASTQLLRLVTSELKGDPLLYYYSRFSKPLVDAWLEGSVATKEFKDIIDKAPRPPGETASEGDFEDDGGGEHIRHGKPSDPGVEVSGRPKREL